MSDFALFLIDYFGLFGKQTKKTSTQKRVAAEIAATLFL
jgi:hypothetical protein